MKVSEEEEQKILRWREERRFFNEGVDKVIEYLLKSRSESNIPDIVAEVTLLKKEI